MWIFEFIPLSAFLVMVPMGAFLMAMLLHGLDPALSDMEQYIRDVKEMPHYRDERLSEAKHGYSRHLRQVGSKTYVLVAPTQRKGTSCVVWVAGYGRYFSHTASREDFKDTNLVGLDLPHYGRAYVAKGIDTVGNELMSVKSPETGKKFVEYYYEVYDDAINELHEMGYSKIVFMCNSTAGLSFQCFASDVLSKREVNSVAGVIYTAPFWTTTSPPLRILPYIFWRSICAAFPKLILFSDDVMPTGESASHDKNLIKANNSGRSVHLDPAINLTENAPYYIEWFCMVTQGQAHLRRVARERTASAGGFKKALLVTTKNQEDEPYVHLDECFALFKACALLLFLLLVMTLTLTLMPCFRRCSRAV